MVNIGRYMLDIPSAMVTAAEETGFPLITLPWEVDFTEVTHAIHEYILQEQYALAEQADHIHQTLTRLVLEGGDLSELTRQMAKILHCSVAIEDPSLRLLAHTTNEPSDEVRKRSIQLGRTPDDVTAYLQKQNLFEKLRQNPKPFHLPPNPSVGFTRERIVSPVLVGSQLFGYIWIIASDRPLTSLDYLVIERGAVVAALILSRQEAIYETEQRLKTQLFEGLLDPASASLLEGLPENAWQAGLRNGCIVMALDGGSMDRQSRRQLTGLVEEHMACEGIWTTAIERGERLAVVAGTTNLESMRSAAEGLVAFTRTRGFHLKAGISSASKDVDTLRRQYQEAEDTLTLAKTIGQNGQSVWTFDDLGFLGDLLFQSKKGHGSNRYMLILEKIVQYDLEKRTQYFHTLETYIDHLSIANQAAQALYIHRNTLYQRLAKMSDLWGINFQDPLIMLNLNLAVKTWHIDKNS